MCGGILTLIKKLKVKNIIITKQKEESENFKEFLKIIGKRQSNIILAEAEKRIEVEDNICIDILWPTSNLEISENALNNNSIVAKINYKNFSILLTGDIEEKAEKKILENYQNNQRILKSNVLKVAHHGSKSSSTKDFLEKVKPDIAIIGVGKRNKFGHPNCSTLENLNRINCKIYRTDENGEIKIRTNGITIKEINTNQHQ